MFLFIIIGLSVYAHMHTYLHAMDAHIEGI